MKIEVTNCETQEKTIYDYSKNNWALRWACMKDGLVHMWAPNELRGVNGLKNNPNVLTSGRIWRVLP